MQPEQSYFARRNRGSILAKLDSIIKRLRDKNVQRGANADVRESEVHGIAIQVADSFMFDPVVIDLQLAEPLYIVGDILGQFGDLLNIFEKLGYPPQSRYLFLGNYGDRGNQSIEVFCLLFALKLKYPKHIHMLRGNHDCEYVSWQYGFLAECVKRFSKNVWKVVMNALNCLPAVAIIEDCIFCVHSGLVPCIHYSTATSLAQLRMYITDIIRRPVSLTENFLLTHLTWSEPVVDTHNYSANPAGLGQWFGEKVVEDFCQRFGLQLVIRSHDFIQNGYEFTAGGKLLTIFSASNMGDVYRNLGAVVYLRRAPDGYRIVGRIKVIVRSSRALRGARTKIPLTVIDSLEYKATLQKKAGALAMLQESLPRSRGKYIFFT
ncbi:unnamed protein product [Dicrocoelium dendriticum]|nr:unnamed protein product [Dicrocoelium dendriticum]